MKILGIDYGDQNIGLALAEDNSLTAHFEHTVAVTKSGHIVITK